MAEERKTDPKILEEIVSSLIKIRDSGSGKIDFNGTDYSPDELINEVRNKTKIGLDYYQMSVRYRELAKNLKPR
ncbi:MAG TPA: hypothetical protein VJH92_05255 [Candidatus Nanoarchaeia archaeon]|nr:hypothetical protein [Candidatus Nanoarchaeia archaeon]